jgi:hypothetical protein
MTAKKEKSFNEQVFELTCKRLNLKRREKIIFFRFMGLIVNRDKPIHYSISSLSLRTGYSRSSIFESLNLLEKYRLIQRIGHTNSLNYVKGSILIRICSLVQNRSKQCQFKNKPLVQKLDESSSISPETGYYRTYTSLERKKKGVTPQTKKPFENSIGARALSDILKSMKQTP